MSNKHRSLASQSREIQHRRFAPEFAAGMQSHIAVTRRSLAYLFNRVSVDAPEVFIPAEQQANVPASVGEIAVGRTQSQEALTTVLGHGATQEVAPAPAYTTEPQLTRAYTNREMQATTPYVSPQTEMERRRDVTANIDRRTTPGYIDETILGMEEQFDGATAANGQPVTTSPEAALEALPVDPITAAQQAVAAAIENRGVLQDA